MVGLDKGPRADASLVSNERTVVRGIVAEGRLGVTLDADEATDEELIEDCSTNDNRDDWCCDWLDINRCHETTGHIEWQKRER